MNSKHLIPLLLLLGTQLSAQTIVIKAEEKEKNIVVTSIKKTLNRKNDYKVQIEGLNSAKYKITIEPKFTRKKTDIPAILAPVFPNIPGVEDRVKEKFNINLKAFKKMVSGEEELTNFKSLTASKEARDRIDALSPSLRLVFDKIDKHSYTLRTLKENFEEVYAESDDNIKGKAESILKIKTEDEHQSKLDDYEQEIRDAMNGFNANVALLEALVNKLSLDNFTDEFVEEFTKAKGSSQFVQDNKDVFLKMVKFIGKASISAKVIDFPEMEINGDFTTVEIKVIKTNKDLITETFVTEQKFSNRNYIKWLNVTGGFFGNNLVNPEFVVSSDKTSILTEKRFKYDVSVGAMANVNYVLRPEFKIGAGFGVALSPFDGKTRYLLGLTTTFGVRNEFALSGGFIWAKLQALSSSISSNGSDYDRPLNPTSVTVDKESTNTTTNVTTTTHDVTKTSNTFSTVPTFNKWYRGMFIGITYSFLKR